MKITTAMVLLAAIGCRNPDSKDSAVLDDTAVDSIDTFDTADSGEPIPENIYTVDEDMLWSEDIQLGTVWYVPAGVTLTISAGVNVSFLPGAGIIVDGTLTTEGTTEAPVSFRSSYSQSSGTYGVAVGGDSDASTLNNVVFESIDLRLEGEATASISGATFADSTLSVYSRTGPFSIDSSSFADNLRDNQTAVLVRDVAQLSVSGCAFQDTGHAIQYDGTREGAWMDISTTSFVDVRRAALVGSIGEFQHTVTVSDVTVEGAVLQAFAFYRTDASLNDVAVTETLSHGVYSDADSHLSWTNGSVEDAGALGIYAVGSATLTDVSVTNTDSHGIYAGEDGSELTRVTVTDVEGYGIYSNGPLVVRESQVSQGTSVGIYAAYGSLDVSDTSVSNVLSHGVYSIYGPLTATRLTLTEIENYAIYGHSDAVSVSETDISSVRGYGIYAYRGDTTVSDVTISDIENTAIYTNDGALTVNNAAISDARGYGVISTYGDMELTDVSIVNTINSAVYANRGDITINAGTTGMRIEDTDGYAVYASTGSIVADSLTVSRTRSHGVYAAYGDVTLTNASLTDIGGNGAYSYYGSATISNTVMSNITNTGVYTYLDDATLTNVSVTDAGDRGVYIGRGDLTATNLVITNAGLQGIYVNEGDGFLTDVSISDTSGRGYYGSDGDAIMERVRVVDLDGDGSSSESAGLDVRGYLLATDVLVDHSEGYGVYAEQADLSYATLTNNDGRGVYIVDQDEASTVSYSTISDNLSYGVQGPTTGVNQLDVTNSNIHDNYYYGVYFARLVDGCYVADNYDGVGVDLTEDLTLDGSLDLRTDQLYNIDAVSAPQSALIASAGSSLSAQ